jgi:predicted transcriptional regulator
MTKAIISISNFKETADELLSVAARLDAGEQLSSTNYHLNFATASQLFAELTPKRMELLETLKRTGPQSIYRLAKLLGRNYSNVHTSVARLMELGLIDKDEKNNVFVQWEDIEIHVSLSSSRAAA